MSRQAANAEPAPVFIVSTGRCGSTLLTNMIRLNPEVLSLSEFFGTLLSGPFPPGDMSGPGYAELIGTPHPFVTMAYRAGVRVTEFLYRPGPGSEFTPVTGIPPILVTTLPHLSEQPVSLYHEVAEFARTLPTAPVATQHRRLFEYLRQRAGAAVWVERSGFSLRYLPSLVTLFPGARFVHLFRDGRESAYSMSRSAAFRLGAVWLKFIEALGVNPFVEEVPPGAEVPAALLPLMPGSFDAAAFEEIELPVADFARTWNDEILTALPELARLAPGMLHSVRYEDLVSEPRAVLRELAEFIGPVSAPGWWLDAAAALVQPRPPQWLSLPAADQAEITEICRPAMDKLYGPRNAAGDAGGLAQSGARPLR